MHTQFHVSAGFIDVFFCSGCRYTWERSEFSNCMSVCVCYSGPSVLRHRDHLLAAHLDGSRHNSQTLVGT